MKPTAAQAALGARRIQPKALSTGGVVFMVYHRNSGLQCAWFIIIVPVTTQARADGQPRDSAFLRPFYLFDAAAW